MTNNGHNGNRVNIRVEQTLDVARRYNDPEYVIIADRHSDVSTGGIYIYEILKMGIRQYQLRALFDSSKRDLSADAISVLDTIVEIGIAEFKESGKIEFITK